MTKGPDADAEPDAEAEAPGGGPGAREKSTTFAEIGSKIIES